MNRDHDGADVPEVMMEPMGEGGFDSFIAHSIAGYAMDLIRTYHYSPSRATAYAADGVAALLPEGMASPGHSFFNLCSATTERVGYLWLEVRSENGEPATLFICDLEIHSAFRRQGWARSALMAAEKWALARGIHRMELNVFADNEAALALYRTQGLVPCEITMGKNLE